MELIAAVTLLGTGRTGPGVAMFSKGKASSGQKERSQEELDDVCKEMLSLAYLVVCLREVLMRRDTCLILMQVRI